MPLTKLFKATILFVVSIVSLHSYAESNYVLKAIRTNGNSVSIAFDDRPVIVFHGNSFSLKSSKDAPSYYAMEGSLRKFVIEETHPTAVTSVDTQIDYKFGDNLFIAYNVGADANVSLYSADGKKIPAAVNSDGNNITIELSTLEKGIYIIKVNHFTCKYYKQ